MSDKNVNYKQWIIIAVLLVIIAFLGYMEYDHRRSLKIKDIAAEPENIVNVLKITPENITVAQNFIGKTEAVNSVDIYPQVSGYIASIMVKGGENVHQGDVLLVIEQAPFIAAVDSAEADKFSAQAEMLNAKHNYTRFKKAGEEAVSQSELENAATAYSNAFGKYKQAVANLEQAKVNLDYTVLRAPFSGVIGHIALSEGDYVTPQGQKLMSIVQYDPIRVVFSVTDKEYLQKKQKGLIFSDDVIKLKLSDGKIYEYDGHVEYSSNELDTKTDSLAVYALFKNNQRLLLPNAYVGVMVEQIYDDAVVIDKTLLINKVDGKYVYVIDDDELKLKKVNILTENDSSYILSNDFSTKEQLVAQAIEPNLIGHKIATKQITAEE